MRTEQTRFGQTDGQDRHGGERLRGEVATESTTELTSERVASTTGVAAVTVNVSPTPATPSSSFNVIVWPSCTCRSGCRLGTNPCSVALTWYRPTGNPGRGEPPVGPVTMAGWGDAAAALALISETAAARVTFNQQH